MAPRGTPAQIAQRARLSAGYSVRYSIDGRLFATINQLHGALLKMGFDGSVQCVHARIKAGATTFAELLKPLHHHGNPAGSGKNPRRTAERAKMAELIAELDARKRAITEQNQ